MLAAMSSAEVIIGVIEKEKGSQRSGPFFPFFFDFFGTKSKDYNF